MKRLRRRIEGLSTSSLTLPPRRGSPPARDTVTARLVSPVCDESPSLTLTVDRPIDVSLFRVHIAPLGFTYVGRETPILTSPTTVQILLAGIEEYAGPGVILTASPGSGIAASEGGAAWAGVTGLSLPLA